MSEGYYNELSTNYLKDWEFRDQIKNIICQHEL
jgi:hypothetical protein